MTQNSVYANERLEKATFDKVLKCNKSNKRSMIVGDMDLDVLSGKKAGILTCAATYGIGRKEDIVKVEPGYIMDDIVELKDIIK